MRAIETTNFQTAPRLLARYGESRGWMRRHIKNYVFPQPFKRGSASDSRTARSADSTFPRPISFSPSKSAMRFWRRTSIAMNAELARINGDAS
jgi:hypothetical protein